MASQPTHFGSTFPTVPSSLSTDGHGMRDHYAEQEHTTQRPSQHTLQDITPYLGLRARLSQVPINRWTILLLLVLVRVLIAIGNLHHDIDAAKVKALAACSSVESMGSAMASMPHFMAQGTNEMTAKGIEKTVNGLESLLFLTITALEEIFVFVINMMYGTYECLITLAVGTAGHAAIALAEDVTKFLNDTIGEITGDLDTVGTKFEDGLNKFTADLTSVFNKETPPKLDLTGPIDKLKGLKIPTGVQDELQKLDRSIPNFDQIHNATNTILKAPFELIKKELKEHLGNFTFNRSAFPVPQRKQLAFCSDDDGINDFFNSLYNIANTSRKVFIAVLLIAAILACIPIAYMEIRRWKTMQERASLIAERAHDPMDTVYIASRPYTAQAGLKVSRWFAAPKKQVLARWFISYVTSLPALLVLALALAGLLSCLCQYVLLQAVRKEVPALANHVGAFADKVVDALDTASSEWANATNGVILGQSNKINTNMLGWVNKSTTAVNDTLNSFVQETTDLLHDAFGNTILFDAFKGVFDCLIGLKVAALQKGLTWAHDNAHVDFPTLPTDLFSAGASKAVAASDPSAGQSSDSFIADPNSGATDKITGAVVDLTDKLLNGVRTEALISTAVLGIYLLIVLGALTRCLLLFCRREKNRAEGGVSYAGDIQSSSATPQLTGSTDATTRNTDAAPAYERFTAFKSPMPSSNTVEKERQWNSNELNPFNPVGQQRGHVDYPDEKGAM